MERLRQSRGTKSPEVLVYQGFVDDGYADTDADLNDDNRAANSAKEITSNSDSRKDTRAYLHQISEQFGSRSWQYVVASAHRQEKRGKSPSATLELNGQLITNPSEALKLAKDMQRIHLNLEALGGLKGKGVVRGLGSLAIATSFTEIPRPNKI